MALQKTIPTKIGVDATYWSIDEVNINKQNKTAHITLSGYVSEDAKKNNNAHAIAWRHYNFRGSSFNDYFSVGKLDINNGFAIGYEYIKGITKTVPDPDQEPVDGIQPTKEIGGEFSDAISV